MIHCNSGGRFTEGSHFKHCKPYVFSAYSNQKFLCEWLCIMTDQISGFLYQKYNWKFILQFLLLTCNLFCCTLTCLTVNKLLSLFLSAVSGLTSIKWCLVVWICSCRSIARSSQPPVTAVLSTFCCLRNSESIGIFDVPSFEFDVSLLRSVHSRFSVPEKICPPKRAPEPG